MSGTKSSLKKKNILYVVGYIRGETFAFGAWHVDPHVKGTFPDPQ